MFGTDPYKCTAIEVCEEPPKGEPRFAKRACATRRQKNLEPCGETFCEYPFVCATPSRQGCKALETLRAHCKGSEVCKAGKAPASSSSLSQSGLFDSCNIVRFWNVHASAELREGEGLRREVQWIAQDARGKPVSYFG